MARSLVNDVLAPDRPDELIFSVHPQHLVMGVTISAGAGVLKRGACLSLEDDGTHVLLGSGDGKANVILCDDTDTGDDDGADPVYVPAYRRGHFNRIAVNLATGADLTTEDRENLRDVGILLSDAH